MTHPQDSINTLFGLEAWAEALALGFAFDGATQLLARARHLHLPGEAEKGAQSALEVLEDLPESTAFARTTALAIVADVVSGLPWSRELDFRCMELEVALNGIRDAIDAAQMSKSKAPRNTRGRCLFTQSAVTRALKGGRAVDPNAQVKITKDGELIVGNAAPDDAAAADTSWDDLKADAQD